MTQSEFDAIYWASKDPRLQKLTDIPPNVGGVDPFADRKTGALALATEGLQVDTQTMVWGWDPYLVMILRQQFSVQTVPSLLNAGLIKVSLDPADYPAFAPAPPTPQPAPVTSLVGASEGFDSAGVEYFACTLDSRHIGLQDGQSYSGDPRGTFIYHFKLNPFGGSEWFTKA